METGRYSSQIIRTFHGLKTLEPLQRLFGVPQSPTDPIYLAKLWLRNLKLLLVLRFSLIRFRESPEKTTSLFCLSPGSDVSMSDFQVDAMRRLGRNA